MKRNLALLAVLGVASGTALGQMGAAHAGHDDALLATGLSGGTALVRLVVQDDGVEKIGRPVPLSGLTLDTRLVGIDVRPNGGALYGLGDRGGVYTLDRVTGSATKVATLDQTLSGSSFDIDFNPTVDRLRIISDTGQNLRANVDTGATLVDGTLNYPVDGGTGPAAQGVSGAAYTNSDNSAATGTQLFYLDTVRDTLVTTSAPNAGSLTTVRPLGVDASGDAGFDIQSTVDPATGATTANAAFAVLRVKGKQVAYRVDLGVDGPRLQKLGNLPGGLPITDVAVLAGQ